MNSKKRKQIIQDGTYHKFCDTKRKAWKKGEIEKAYIPKIIGHRKIAYVLNPNYFNMDIDILNECEKIRRCKKAQRNKIKKHIEYLFNRKDLDIYFGTFTFNDKALKLSADTRKQKIRRMLSKANDYILNIDFGKENEREHYHAIIALEKGTYNANNDNGYLVIDLFKKYDYGYMSFEPVRRTENDAIRLARYIDKLTSHTIKVSQQYVSVKKGSDYQLMIKEDNFYKTKSKENGIYKSYSNQWRDRPIQARFIKENKNIKKEQLKLRYY